jgi:tetratricopeptide (TPR) repeat protein
MTPPMVANLLREGLGLHRQGALAQARDRYLQVLEYDRANPDAIYLLGAIAFQERRFEDAIGFLEKAISLVPARAAAHRLLGNTRAELGEFDKALASFERALSLEPQSLDALIGRANSCNELQRWDEAVADYDRIIALKPDIPEAWHNRSLALFKLRRTAEALESIDRVAQLRSGWPPTHQQRGHCLRALKRYDEAIAEYDRVLALQPQFVEALLGRALALEAAKRPAEALACCDRADAVAAAAETHVTRGYILANTSRDDEALACFDHALALQPEHIESHHRRGLSLHALGRFEDAAASLDHAARQAPQAGKIHSDLAFTLNTLGRFDDAFAAADHAQKVSPGDDDVLFTTSLIELLHGRWPQGWKSYDSRLAVQGVVQPLPYPRWAGETLTDEVLVLVTEQGLGDAIQFMRLVHALAGRVRRIALLTTETLKPLLSTIGGLEGVVTDAEELKALGEVRWLPLASIAGVLGITTETVPAGVPYLALDPARVSAWGERIGRHGFKVGIGWQGNPGFRHDRGRSIPLAAFAPLAGLAGVRLISLQKAPGIEQVSAAAFGGRIEQPLDACDLGGDALLDTAAVIANLDLVVTSDSMLAHLAGALARPVWVALRRVPDWRWLLDREDSPWYPTMRLFRQATEGDWGAVLDQIARAARDSMIPKSV